MLLSTGILQKRLQLQKMQNYRKEMLERCQESFAEIALTRMTYLNITRIPHKRKSIFVVHIATEECSGQKSLLSTFLLKKFF